MFSQFRQAVENLATQPPRRSTSVDEHGSPLEERSRTPEAQHKPSTSLGSAHLADAALSNLRKTLGSQRTSSPIRTASPGPASGPDTGRRPNLEERLRAKFTIGEASPTPVGTPDPSGRSSPALQPEHADIEAANALKKKASPALEADAGHPLSPTSTPLPDSPALSPTEETSLSLDSAIASLDSLPRPNAESPYNARTTPSPSPSPASREPLESGFLPEVKTDEVSLSVQTRQQHEHEHIDADIPSCALAESASLDVSSPALASVGEVALSGDEMTSEHQPRQESVSPKSQLRDLADLSTTTADDSFTAEADGSSIGDHEVTKNQETSISETAPSENPSIAIQTPLPRSPISPHLTSEARIAALVSPVVGGEMDQVSRPSSRSPASADVEALQQRLKLVEQRFADVSTSFKRLQAEKRAVDGILRELTPIEGMQDQVALRDYLQNMNQKLEISQDEIMRLNGKLTRQEERLEELRDTHRLESASFTEEADNLRQQLEAAKNALQAAESVKAKSDEEAAKHRAEIERLKNENEKASTMAKDEEEKRVKAIALLKTVRQKLVKTEKDRDDAIKDANATKGKDKEELARLHHEIEKVNAEREQAITGMRAHFDRELAGLKERQAKDIAALRGQFELEAISTKAAHAKELAARDSKIAVLENSVRNLTNEKNKYFDLLQVRQGEYESAESHSQSLEAQTTELQYQLREANERICLLTEELLEARREQDHGRRKPSVSAEEVTLNLQATEARYENMLREVRKQIEALEAERADAEAMWARRLEEKAKEVENLRELVDTNRESSGIKEQSMKESQQQVDRLKEELRLVRLDVQKMQREVDAAREAQTGAQEESKELGSKLAALEKLIEEVKLRETQLKAANKALRGELHKVQTSAALLERQRNPGVGYWSASRQDLPDNVEMDSRISVSSTSDVSRNSTPRIGSPTPTSGSEEEINLEYLRNVILQFLEHKEMRPNLVRVLAAILRFTPQETRRLVAKV